MDTAGPPLTFGDAPLTPSLGDLTLRTFKIAHSRPTSTPTDDDDLPWDDPSPLTTP